MALSFHDVSITAATKHPLAPRHSAAALAVHLVFSALEAALFSSTVGRNVCLLAVTLLASQTEYR